MAKFEFKVNIHAENNQDAKKILKALLEVNRALSKEEILSLSKAIKEKPHLIKKAKMFL
jgi:hypothetical protein